MKKYFLYITLIMVLICPSLSLCEESSSNYEPIYRFINKYNEIVSEPIQIVSEDVVKHRLSTFNGYPIVHIYIGEDENSRFSNGSIQTYRYRGFRMMFY